MKRRRWEKVKRRWGDSEEKVGRKRREGGEKVKRRLGESKEKVCRK